MKKPIGKATKISSKVTGKATKVSSQVKKASPQVSGKKPHCPKPKPVIRVYSTGPLENAATNFSATVFTKLLNNSAFTRTAVVTVFKLNGVKVLVSTQTVTIPPNSSAFVTADVAALAQFEVQVRVNSSRVLVGVFGKTAADELNPTHRLVHDELTRIL
ncbi:hypothetical protein [Paenibacillus sp. 481]|uniref:hypothetical protein n=1 Tax=Paenibacillus sp. 481 TaxID=2835869 RepID=UPI001E3FA99B|nr:hypothetical protein [Paenibacillus sp. 481]UHA72912.1 hypothetical protein KIK04_20190 [Paenibacillus sp. 481]